MGLCKAEVKIGDFFFFESIGTRMKILVLIDQYKRGGAARVTSTMINGLVQHGYNISLATNNVTQSIGYPVDKNIEILSYYGGESHNKFQSIIRHFKLFFSARTCVKKTHPDVIIAVTYAPYMYVKIATCFSKIPIIAVDHTSFSRKISWWEDWVRYHFYKYADVLTILTQKDKALLGHRMPNKVVVYNPLSFPPLDHETAREKNILVAGRLSFWKIKGIDRIIDIWSRLTDKYVDWILEIAGDGDDKSINYLKTLVSQKGLDNKVRFLGQVHDMKTKLSKTSIFALPSRVEGFPMVLMEAMSQGCACVAFTLGGACNEMMSDGKSGYIVEDGNLDAFSNSLIRLLDNPVRRDNFGKNAISECSRFSVDSFINSWVNLLDRYKG